jgi:hypothetical protein
MSRSVDELYRKLNSVADQLSLEQGREVSMNKALLQLIEYMKLEPSDFWWSWRINKTSSMKTDHDKNPVPTNRFPSSYVKTDLSS